MAGLEALILEFGREQWDLVADCMELRVRQAAPFDTGELSRSIRSGPVSVAGSVASFEITQDAGQAQHGPILENITPGATRPKSALSARGRPSALRFDPGGGEIFRRSIQRSTVHRGWWSDMPFDQFLGQCVR